MPPRKLTTNDLANMIGETIGPSEWLTITQDVVNQYGHAVNDLEWIHIDVPRAKAAFGGTIVYGLLTLSHLPTMWGMLIDLTDRGADLVYGFDNVRFLNVVHGGDRIRMSTQVISMEPRGEGVLYRSRNTIEVEGRDKPAVVADWLLLVFPKGETALAKQAKLEGAGA
ncbi:MAG: MaoC family dehydratase [Hyphomonadaceae bacterium]